MQLPRRFCNQVPHRFHQARSTVVGKSDVSQESNSTNLKSFPRRIAARASSNFYPLGAPSSQYLRCKDQGCPHSQGWHLRPNLAREIYPRSVSQSCGSQHQTTSFVASFQFHTPLWQEITAFQNLKAHRFLLETLTGACVSLQALTRLDFAHRVGFAVSISIPPSQVTGTQDLQARTRSTFCQPTYLPGAI